MQEIQLTHGKISLVDDEDYVLLKRHHWIYGEVGYAVTSIGKSKIYLHHLIIGNKEGFECDHINGNRLDNRKENLRLCTKQQNIWNSAKKRGTTSKYRGVSYSNKFNKWRVRVNKDKKEYHVGFFEDEKEAAMAWNEKAREMFGEYARLNII